MTTSPNSIAPGETAPAGDAAAPRPSLLSRWLLAPVMKLLAMGATPEKLAWSLAVGCAIGINPLFGTTSIVVCLLAFVFRLNLVASQISNHIVYPLQIALFFVFVRIGEMLFGAGQLPLKRRELLHAMRHHPLSTTEMLWSWEWHALVVWAIAALLLTPVIAAILRPMLARLLEQLRCKDQPVKSGLAEPA